jgi:hypothetical protein
MNTFPTLSCAPKISGWSDAFHSGCVEIGATASGYPVANKLVTFVPKDFSHTLQNVSQADKEIVEAFYIANMDVPFYWLNEQNNTIYEVMFTDRPSTQTQDDDNKELWQIELSLIQTAATEYPSTFVTHKFYGGDAMIEVVNLAAGADITLTPAYVAAQGMVIMSAWLLTKGTPAGIDNSNTVVITLKDKNGNVVLTKTFNMATQPPTNGSLDLSSLLDDDYTTLTAGDRLDLIVTQGTTANMPAFSIILGGYFL